LQMDAHYLLQAVADGVVLHDRLLLQSNHSIGQVSVISYREGIG
jgi:hypothetical protein